MFLNAVVRIRREIALSHCEILNAPTAVLIGDFNNKVFECPGQRCSFAFDKQISKFYKLTKFRKFYKFKKKLYHKFNKFYHKFNKFNQVRTSSTTPTG